MAIFRRVRSNNTINICQKYVCFFNAVSLQACFDVRVGSMLWKKMDLKSKIIDGDVEIPEWMSTHPDNESRAEHLDFLLPEVCVNSQQQYCQLVFSRPT